MSPALNFKPNSNKLTEFRIKLVMKYVTHCYLQMIADGRKYDLSKRGRLQKEDYLRNGLVDDYLSKKQYKDYYKDFISDNPNVEIYFQKEENQVYQIGESLSDDYIDISVKETKLSDILSGETGDEIKFAIECKRIKAPNDYNEYIKDIQKFVDRPFTSYRLPFEGQIAFIENDKLPHNQVFIKLNERLKITSTINTIEYLNSLEFHSGYDGCYCSKHKRNYTTNNNFSVFHLLLDYGNIVIDLDVSQQKSTKITS